MPAALVAIGSNLGDRRAQLERALELLRAIPGLRVQAVSRWHETPPVGGPAGQGAFLNGVLRLETSLGPEPLRQALTGVERELGRERDVRWQARSLDLDLLLYDGLVLAIPELIVPHPRMAFRRFVLEPAAEVAPQMIHPRLGWSVARMLEHLQHAPAYVAITGIPGVGKTRLLETLAADDGVRPIAAPQVPCAARGKPPSRVFDEQIKWVATGAGLLAAHGATAGAGWTASDFWLEQSLAYGSLEFGAELFARFAAEVAALADRVVRPKLLVVLTVPQLAGPAERLQSALVRCAQRAGVGPLLEISHDDWPRVVQEVSAALSAMR